MFHVKDKARVRGEYRKFDVAPWVPRGGEILRDLSLAVRTGNERVIRAMKRAGVITSESYACNIIPTVGRNVWARRLAGDTTYTGEVDWGALGTGASPSFTNASTQLNNEVFRLQADSQAFDDNIAYVDWFIEAADVANGTYTEWGAFIDGTGSANTGRAWSLLATGGWVKSGSMFVSAKYTLL